MTVILFTHSRLAAMFIVVAVIGGCATPPAGYKGPGPRLDARGPEAQVEIRKFSLNEETWRGNIIELGPERIPYSLESYERIMAKVSPEAENKLKDGRRWGTASSVGLGIGIATLVGMYLTQDQPTRTALATISIAGSASSIVFGVISSLVATSVSVPYNRDLRRQLAPGFALNFSY